MANETVLATRLCARAMPSYSQASPSKCLPKEGRRSAARRIVFGAASADAAARHTGECCHSLALRARAPPGAPPRRLPRKSMPWLSPGRVSCDLRAAGVSRRALSQSSEAPRRPVIMPADPMPGPPGSGVTSPARGNRSRPVSRLSPVTTLRGRDSAYVTGKETNVKLSLFISDQRERNPPFGRREATD